MRDLREFLESTIDFEGAGYDSRQNTLENAAKQLHIECIEWDKRPKALSVKFRDALQGLPSYINIPFYNFDIINLMKALDLESFDTITTFSEGEETVKRETNEERTVDNFWIQCGIELERVFNEEFYNSNN